MRSSMSSLVLSTPVAASCGPSLSSALTTPAMSSTLPPATPTRSSRRSTTPRGSVRLDLSLLAQFQSLTGVSLYIALDYRWFDANNIEPRYEFGYGLSYTTFAYSGLSLKATFGSAKQYKAQLQTSGLQPGGDSGLWSSALTASFTVKNTGSVDGNEVAQLYLGFPASAAEPPRVLRGFERQLIKKGQSVKFSIPLRVKDISIWDVITQSWVIPTGTFTVYIGSSSRLLHLTKTFVL